MKYKKPLGATILSLLTCLALTLGAAASEWEEVTLRPPSQSALPAARLIEGTTYVPFRAFCDAWGADGQIEWEGDSRTARYRGTGLEISAAIGQCYLQANGRVLCRGKENLLLDDRTYVPIRALADAFTLQVEWQDGGIGSRSVTLTGSPRAIESAEAAYDGEDLLWLSRVISAEAEGESFEGKLAVGSVVMNRVRSDQFPDSVHDVIFDMRYGVPQFYRPDDPRILITPSEQSILAAKACLDGYLLDENVLFYLNPRIATSFWIVHNRPFLFSLGLHDFYA